MSRPHSYSHSRAHSPSFQSLHLRHSSFSNPSLALPTSQLILQHFRHFTYVTGHSPTLPSLYLRQNSISNPYVASPTSQLILLPFFRLCYVTGFSLTSPGEPSIVRKKPGVWQPYLHWTLSLSEHHLAQNDSSPIVRSRSQANTGNMSPGVVLVVMTKYHYTVY